MYIYIYIHIYIYIYIHCHIFSLLSPAAGGEARRHPSRTQGAGGGGQEGPALASAYGHSIAVCRVCKGASHTTRGDSYNVTHGCAFVYDILPSAEYAIHLSIEVHRYTRLFSNSAPTWSSRYCVTACHF